LGSFLEVRSHLLVLGLKQIDVLVGCLVVVEQASDPRLAFIINDLFFEDLELEVHEVNLLLQVSNVLFFDVLLVRVATQ